MRPIGKCKIYKKSATFFMDFQSPQLNPEDIFMEITGTLRQSVGFPAATRKRKDHVAIFLVLISEQIRYVVALCNVKFRPA